MNFIQDFITQLQNISRHSKSIPAQMCGEAAELIQKITDHEALLKENESLKEELSILRHAQIPTALNQQLPPAFTTGGISPGSIYPIPVGDWPNPFITSITLK